MTDFGSSDSAPFAFFAALFRTGDWERLPNKLSKPTAASLIGGSTALLEGK